MSISNNIAEGAGSESDEDFAHFLNIARRSAFETANIVLFIRSKTMINDTHRDKFLTELEEISRMITAFRRNI